MAATGLLMDAARKSVSGVTGGPPMLETPKPRAHSILPSWITAMLTPGMCRADMRSASFGVAIGSPLTITEGGSSCIRWIRCSIAEGVWAEILPKMIVEKSTPGNRRSIVDMALPAYHGTRVVGEPARSLVRSLD